MNFRDWWEQNKALYERLNIPKDIAHTIWMAAIDNYVIVAEEKLRKYYK